MAIKLNTAQSVVDYLKSQKQPTDFTSRAALYKEKGFEERLGKYVGSSNQNVAFLRQLQGEQKTTPVAPVTPESVQQVTPAPAQPSVPVIPEKRIDVSGLPPSIPTDVKIPEPKPLTATDALANLGFEPSTLTADQALGKDTGAPLFGVFKKKQELASTLAMGQAEADKQKLETIGAQETKEFINTMGRRGLFFSGETETGIKSLADSLAASKLGVDRELAGKILSSDLDLQERIIKDVQDIVEKAQSDNEKEAKRALDILEDQGLTIGPDGKTLVPTLAAERERLAVEREARTAEMQIISQQLTQERFESSQKSIEERFERSQATTQQRFERVQKRLEEQATGLTAAEQKASGFDNIKSKAAKDLMAIAASSADKYTDPDKYLAYRNQVKQLAPHYIDDFDDAFSVLLSPEDAQNLGIIQDDPFEVARQRAFRTSVR